MPLGGDSAAVVAFAKEDAMASYYVNDNAQANGDHEVHVETCSFLPARTNRTYVGEYSSCSPAVKKARERWNQVNGCYYCCNPCHTQ